MTESTRSDPEGQTPDPHDPQYKVEVDQIEIGESGFFEYRVTIKTGPDAHDEKQPSGEDGQPSSGSDSDLRFWVELQRIRREISKVSTEQVTKVFLRELHTACADGRIGENGLHDLAVEWMNHLVSNFVQYRITLVRDVGIGLDQRKKKLPDPFDFLIELRKSSGDLSLFPPKFLAKVFCCELFEGCDVEQLLNQREEPLRALNAEWLVHLADERFDEFLAEIEAAFEILLSDEDDPQDDDRAHGA
ncbi:hypothetical protein NONI108955_36790 [Nocardia ninae]|uniref:Uncharacterized protein n=1 Tax=Nocardia ninae NBRC 108245 TaxID=1210091 RepID=A0A511MDC6_9NOCA|nr:hypothetical protein [Nocardia ninae]GEM38650.1 hypothetical protein NN4_31690 [Nocardia ninae NBRC 108245]